jgi:CYTH domain-containing protein
MALEIERKFLVKDDRWRQEATGTPYCQAYILTQQPGKTVRIRTVGDHAFLTLKGKTDGYTRLEFEYEIPLADGQLMLDKLCDSPKISKIRYKVPFKGLIWEIDEFLGDNQGLILAEVELQQADQPLAKPDWIGKEVTADLRYYNSNLARNPYKNWINNL